MRRLIKLYKLYFFVLAFPLVLVTACSDNVEILPEERFLKIYDDDQFNASYIPLDIVQTTDNGYLILSGFRKDNSNFLGVQIIKVNEFGEYISKDVLDGNFVHPVNQLMNISGKYYFICMDELNLLAQLFEVSEDGTTTRITPINTTYPMVAQAEGNSILLLSYDNQNKRSVLSVVGPDGSIVNSQDFDIGTGEGVEDPIISHFNRTGNQLPFQVGRTQDGLYYFNGFYNYTFSLVFTDLSSETPNGVCQGQQVDGGLSSVFPLGINRFAVSRFNFGDNFIIPDADIATNSISSTVDLSGNPFPELVDDAVVVLKSIQPTGSSTLLYGSSTRSGQIILLAYDQSTGELRGTRHLGFVNPYEIGGFTETSDGGLAIVGTSYVAGRFARICLFKLNKNEVRDLIQP